MMPVATLREAAPRLQRGGTSFKSAKPPNGVPWKPTQRTGSPMPNYLISLYCGYSDPARTATKNTAQAMVF
ncbi:hypothetical protein [Tolypothrix sp. FACHB-123]|uniref:hypothetical protein n=1 Tax=Tolypothrix sp. FACHB-123 TaxID=2692868 RepID=UPI001688F101|nr:hypothetical protein [Tolypothrix sp. FACHB-123]